MKKSAFVIIILILCLSLFSCGADKERFFDYQNGIRTVSGTYSADGTERGLTLYFDERDGKRFCRRVEYFSPESLAGISFTLEGDAVTAELDGIRIAYSCYKAQDVFYPARLFSLSEADIYEISGSGKRTVAKGKSEKSLWQVATNEEGVPTEIVFEDKDGAGAFKVEKIVLEEEDSGTK